MTTAKKPKPPKKISESYLHNSGLFYLQRYGASVHQFRQTMTRKIKRSCDYHQDQNMPECLELLEKLIQKLERLKLLDDNAYVETKINSMQQRGYSARMIKQKLATKGITQDTVDTHLVDYDANEYNIDGKNADLIAALKQCRKRRIGPFANSPEKADPQKSLAILARQGFDFDTARTALNYEKKDAESVVW